MCQHFFRELLPDGVAQQAVSAGYISVHVFFVLSGYVLTVQYREVDLSVSSERRAFWWRRFARLYPLYICSLLLGFVALWPGSWESLQTLRGAVRAVVQLCVLNAWWHAAMFPLNFAAWTLSAEMLFYLLFPVLLPRMVRMGDRALCLALGLATALTLVAPTLYTVFDPDNLGRPLSFNEDHVWARYLNFGAPHRVPEFIAGIAVALLVQRGWFAKIRGSAVTSLLASTALVFLAAPPLIPFAYAGGTVLLPIVVVLVVSLDHSRRSWLASAPAVALGRASYATYILHVPVFFALQAFGPHPEDMWQRPLDVAIYVIAMIPISLLAHRWIETPLRKRLIGARSVERSTAISSHNRSVTLGAAPTSD